MVICGIVLDREYLPDLRYEGVKDSKAVKPERREELNKLLEENAEEIEVVEFQPSEIDRLREEGTNLNEIEEMGFVRILNQLNSPTAYLDAVSANAGNLLKIFGTG